MDKIIVVVPTYNEADNLEPLASELWALPIPDLKILVVDDASPDGTGDIADGMVMQNPGKISVLHREGKLGLGSAYISGFKMAIAERPDAIVQMDADFSHSPRYLPNFLDKLRESDAVLGSRYISGGSLDERWGFGRRYLSWFGNFYSRTILNMSIQDATGGFRMWRRKTLEGMPLDLIRSDGYVFQVEMAYVARKLGYNLVEHPIHFEDRRIGQSKMSFRIQIEAAVRVWQILFLHRNLSKPD
ncbi:MAG: polyprenol monophosphomannose synthase [Anaerolineales bacterium]